MTRDEIKQLAVNMARSEGLINLSRSGLCSAAGIPSGSFHRIVGNTFTQFVDELRTDPALSVSATSYRVHKARTNPELRKESILDAAVTVARSVGYQQATLARVAEEAGVCTALVSRYYGTVGQLRRAVMRRAVTAEVLDVLAQGLASRDPQALRAPEELRRRAVESLSAGV